MSPESLDARVTELENQISGGDVMLFLALVAVLAVAVLAARGKISVLGLSADG